MWLQSITLGFQTHVQGLDFGEKVPTAILKHSDGLRHASTKY